MITPIDIQNLAKTIMLWPVLLETDVAGQKYLLAHEAETIRKIIMLDEYYLPGIGTSDPFIQIGAEEYVSICGHFNVGSYIWRNKKENVYLLDCGCGYMDGQLACLCLETKEEFYV